MRHSKRMRRKSKKLLKGGANNLQSRLYALRQTNPNQTRKQMIQALQKKERRARLPSPNTVRTRKKHPNTVRLLEAVEAAKQKQKDLEAGRPIAPTLKKKTKSAYNNAIQEMQSVSRAVFRGPFRTNISKPVVPRAQSSNNKAITKFKNNVSKSSTNADFISAYSKLPPKFKPTNLKSPLISEDNKNKIKDLRKFLRSTYLKKKKKNLGKHIVTWAG